MEKNWWQSMEACLKITFHDKIQNCKKKSYASFSFSIDGCLKNQKVADWKLLILIWIWTSIYCYLLVKNILQAQEYGVEILSAM